MLGNIAQDLAVGACHHSEKRSPSTPVFSLLLGVRAWTGCPENLGVCFTTCGASALNHAQYLPPLLFNLPLVCHFQVRTSLRTLGIAAAPTQIFSAMLVLIICPMLPSRHYPGPAGPTLVPREATELAKGLVPRACVFLAQGSPLVPFNLWLWMQQQCMRRSRPLCAPARPGATPALTAEPNPPG